MPREGRDSESKVGNKPENMPASPESCKRAQDKVSGSARVIKKAKDRVARRRPLQKLPNDLVLSVIDEVR